MTLPTPYYDRNGITIYCGDSLLIAPLLGVTFAVVTDPPYGINYAHSGGGRGLHPRRNCDPIMGDNRPFDPTPWLVYPFVLLWGADRFAQRLPDNGGFIAWDKSLGIGPADGFVDCEFAWCSTRIKRNVFRVLWKGLVKSRAIDQGLRFHPATKPQQLCTLSIALAPVALPILDPFMGSGSFVVSALRNGRRAVGIELEERYCEIAVQRLAQGCLFSAEPVS